MYEVLYNWDLCVQSNYIFLSKSVSQSYVIWRYTIIHKEACYIGDIYNICEKSIIFCNHTTSVYQY